MDTRRIKAVQIGDFQPPSINPRTIGLIVLVVLLVTYIPALTLGISGAGT